MTHQKESTSWRNKYIDLVSTKPELLIPCHENLLSDSDKGEILNRLQHFSECYLELGSGSGSHLIARAEQSPECLFIGFEIRYKRAFRTAEKAEKQKVQNLLVVRHDARIVPSLFPRGSISGIYVNFPDPWAKRRRWTKHRLLKPEYLRELADTLSSSGFLSYKTDHRACFDEVTESLSQISAYYIEHTTLNLYESSYHAKNVPTEFEGLFHHKGFPIFYLLARKDHQSHQDLS